MIAILVAMAGLIGLGALWRALQPGGLAVDQVRTALTGLVYYYLLPALVLEVMWAGDIGLDSVRIALLAAIVVVFGMALGRLAAGLLAAPATIAGAIIIAAGFPNVIYLGLPVLDTVLGPESRAIAIQFDYFAATPLMLTAGVAVAQYYGLGAVRGDMLRRLVRVPPLIAAIVGVGLNLAAVPMPAWLGDMLSLMGTAVVPLMLLALGMSLTIASVSRAGIGWMVPVAAIQLILMPLLAWLLADPIGLEGMYRTGMILEAAMPTMVIGIILCDRYGLDSGFYSMTVTTTTLLSLATLPAWLYLVQGL